MRQLTTVLEVSTAGKGLYNFTAAVDAWLRTSEVSTGLLTAFIQHTSASLTIQENADPDVVLDLNDFFSRIAPEDNRLYRHTAEGPDDMPAHIRAALTQTQISIPVMKGRMALRDCTSSSTGPGRTAAASRCICWASSGGASIGRKPFSLLF